MSKRITALDQCSLAELRTLKNTLKVIVDDPTYSEAKGLTIRDLLYDLNEDTQRALD